jgi:hypothetical protein
MFDNPSLKIQCVYSRITAPSGVLFLRIFPSQGSSVSRPLIQKYAIKDLKIVVKNTEIFSVIPLSFSRFNSLFW